MAKSISAGGNGSGGMARSGIMAKAAANGIIIVASAASSKHGGSVCNAPMLFNA